MNEYQVLAVTIVLLIAGWVFVEIGSRAWELVGNLINRVSKKS